MINFAPRQLSKEKGEVTATSSLGREYNALQKLSYPSAGFIKCPVNIGDLLRDKSQVKVWKDFKLYINYLDLKVQNPDCGTFQIKHSHRHYQRIIKSLIAKGWAIRLGKLVYLRAYQFVWRSLGIARVDRTLPRFKYWKIPVSMFSVERRTHDRGNKLVGGYLKEIEHEIRSRISKRKLAQFRYALKEKDNTRATFSAKSAGSLFGYKSPSTGTKLRSKYFTVIEPKTPEEIKAAKPRFIKERGRFEEPTKQIAL